MSGQPGKSFDIDANGRVLLQAAGELLGSAVLNRPATLADPAFATIAGQPCAGVFVSLKRKGRLRSCCGMLGALTPLGPALQEAAYRTAREDPRFPPISPSELPYLDMEVWVLDPAVTVSVQGEARKEAVIIGKHGIQVARGQARGLLLPGVAVEHGYNAEQFLQQACLKAGLPPHSWKEEGCSLATFEGHSATAALGELSVAEDVVPFRPLSAEQLTAYVSFCRSNVLALLHGSTPNYYFWGAPDANVNGVAISIQMQPGTPPVTVSQLSLNKVVPLQATLFSLCDALAKGMQVRGVPATAINTAVLALAVLSDPSMHGTAAEPDLAGIDSARRAVLVVERSRMGWVTDIQKSPAELVRSASNLARVRAPASASVFSLEVASTAPTMSVSTAPQPALGPPLRPAGVAGAFYPSEPAELSRLVDELLATSEPAPEKLLPWPVVMTPHAGLIYSGRIAAGVFKQIKFPKTIIVIGPKHTPHGVDWSVAPHETWSIPGAELAADAELAHQLADAIPGLELDAMAHRFEHAIEVELPLLARLAPDSKVVGIAIGAGDLEQCRQFAAGLAGVLKQRRERPLIVISSDMNHFAADAENRRLDEIALKALETRDPETVYTTVTENRISMCGVLPAVIALETLRLIGGSKRSKRLGYATSADTTGDKSRVVGYAGMLFV